MSSSRFNFLLPPYRPPLEDYKTDFGIGIVGFGRVVGGFHMPAYRHAGYKVVAAADPDPACREAAREMGVKRVVEDYRELLAMKEVEVIDVAISHRPPQEQARLEVVQAAAEAGKHVLVQKPIASSLEVAVAMVEAAEAGGIHFAVNQNARFGPANYVIKGLLSPERLGRAGVIHIENIVRGGGSRPMEFGSSGARIDWSIHHADLLRWWADSEPTSVYASMAQGASMILYEFATGALAYQLEITSHSLECETPIHIWAERGAIRANHRWNPWSNWPRERVEVHSIDAPEAMGWVSIRLPGDPGAPYGKPSPYDANAPIAGFIGMMGEFMQSIYERRPPLTQARDNLLSLCMCLAAERSAELRQPVDPRTL